MQSFKSKFYGKSDYLFNSKMTGTSWAELAQRGSDVEVSTQQLSYAFAEVWGFARFISSILSCSMRGQRSVVEDHDKESIDESEISIHSSPTIGYVYFKRKSFVCVDQKDFEPVGHCFICTFYGKMFYSSILWEMYKEIFKTRISSSHQEQKHQQSYLSGIVEWWANIYLPFVLTSHVR